MSETDEEKPGYNEEEDPFSDLWVQRKNVKSASWTKIKGRTTVKNESRARKVLGICEDKSEEVLGQTKTWGDDCPICKGKGVVDCKFCPEDGKFDPTCGCKGFAYCTMCRGDNFRKKQAKEAAAKRAEG